ncbi:MAG: DUF3810 domain-containing protein, partial [Clostridia bacterium]
MQKQTTMKRNLKGLRHNPWQAVWVRLPWLLLIPLGFLWPRICAGQSQWIEQHYSAGFYQYLKNFIAMITSIIPISFAELIIYGLIIYALMVILRKFFCWISRKICFADFIAAILSLAILAAVLLNLFYISWGFNYFRTPLAARMGLTVTARSVDELEALVLKFASQAKKIRATLPEDNDGVYHLNNGPQPILNHLPIAFSTLAQTNPVFSGHVTRAKYILLSEGLSWAGISGIYIGLTAEPNINVHQPDLLLAQAAAHEMAHQLGIASEDEAEFTAHLACLSSSDAAVIYSGLMQALIVTGNALYNESTERFRCVYATYSEQMRRDLAAYNAYWDQYEGEINEQADRINDTYLKYNAQESGIKSYGESVDLLLAYYN